MNRRKERANVYATRNGSRHGRRDATSHGRARWWCGLAIALILPLAATASASARGGGGHGDPQQKDQQPAPQQPTTPKPPTVVPEPWPRLEAGATLRRSRDDL